MKSSIVVCVLIMSFGWVQVSSQLPSKLELGLPSNTDGTLITLVDGGSTLFTIDGKFAGIGSANNWVAIKDFWDHDVMTWRRGNIGIGLTNPLYNLHIQGKKGLLVQGDDGPDVAMTPGAGVRMHFYPQKSAFRAGEIIDYGSGEDTFWDHNSIGNHSVAFGYNTLASGDYSMAVGNQSRAVGEASFSVGGSDAVGAHSIAMGLANADGNFSTAIGHSLYANGYHCTVLGGSMTLNGYGSFGIGDGSLNHMTRGTNNRFYARFAEGYYLYTDAIATVGAVLYGGSAWSYFSDSRKKENFTPVDGESILQKIKDFKLGTWNYIGHDPTKFRHYGPMAQDFYMAFGHDGIGTIGCDTLIGSSDIDGINFVAAQALEKRTATMQEELVNLKNMVEKLRKEVETIKMENRQLKAEKAILQRRS